MTRKEERINALQNIGAALFIIGLTGSITVDNCIVLIISWGLIFLGSLLIFIGENKMDKLKKSKKNKGQHRQAHDLYH